MGVLEGEFGDGRVIVEAELTFFFFFFFSVLALVSRMKYQFSKN